MDDSGCPICGEHIRWSRASELLWAFEPYPQPKLRDVVRFFGPNTRTWLCSTCGSVGLVHDVVLFCGP